MSRGATPSEGVVVLDGITSLEIFLGIRGWC